MTLVVGIDLGTSGMKAVAADAAGRPVAHAHCAYPTARPEAGAAEQDPDDWLHATLHVVHSLREQVGAARIEAVSLSAMIPTLLCLGPEGQPLGPAITWEDSRAEPWGEKLVQAAGSEALYDRTGQPVDGRYLVPMYHRLAESQSVRATTICGAKDYLHAWLTGELLTDPSTATGFGCYDLRAHRFDEALLEARTALPSIAPSTTVSPLTAGAAAELGLPEGTPVVLGAADSVLGARGLGATHPGDTAYIWGTSTVILRVAGEPQLDPKRRYLVTPLWDDHLYGLEMDQLSTGAALAWLAGLVGGATAAQLVEEASSMDLRGAPLFLPFLGGGEQGALSDPNLRGALVGLDAANTRAELSRALVNGILRETRRILDHLPPHPGERRPLRGAGGPLGGGGFLGDLACASRMTVLSPRSSLLDHSALGAATLAAEALGIAEPGDDGGFDRTEPVEDRAVAFEEVFARYDDLLAALYPATAARADSS